jgi:hypothetical protein
VKIRNSGIALVLVFIGLVAIAVFATREFLDKPVVDPTLVGAKALAESVSKENESLHKSNADLMNQAKALTDAKAAAEKTATEAKDKVDASKVDAMQARSEAVEAKKANAAQQQLLVDKTRELAEAQAALRMQPQPMMQPGVPPVAASTAAAQGRLDLRSHQPAGNQPRNHPNPPGLWKFLADKAQQDLDQNSGPGFPDAAADELKLKIRAFKAAIAGNKLSKDERDAIERQAANYDGQGRTDEARDVRVALNSR